MATPITTGTIGAALKANPDAIFTAQALANAGATTSAEFMLAQTMGQVELKLVANGAVATGVGETLVITVVTSPTSGGTFDNTIFSKTIPASTTIADGDEIAAYIPSRDVTECYAKLVVTSDFDASALDVDAYLVNVGIR
jgi:hypothetical protein